MSLSGTDVQLQQERLEALYADIKRLDSAENEGMGFRLNLNII